MPFWLVGLSPCVVPKNLFLEKIASYARARTRVNGRDCAWKNSEGPLPIQQKSPGNESSRNISSSNGFRSSSERKRKIHLWSASCMCSHWRSLQRTSNWRNVLIFMHVKSHCFTREIFCFLTFSVSLPSCFRKLSDFSLGTRIPI